MAPAGPMEAEALGSTQADVVAFLSDPASYHQVERVECVETHGNLVFLAGEEAWKIKRAVVFPYMDFSTLEKRRIACSREVEINRRFGSLSTSVVCRSRAHAPAGWRLAAMKPSSSGQCTCAASSKQRC